jgi:hypothetical protein
MVSTPSATTTQPWRVGPRAIDDRATGCGHQEVRCAGRDDLCRYVVEQIRSARLQPQRPHQLVAIGDNAPELRRRRFLPLTRPRRAIAAGFHQ